MVTAKVQRIWPTPVCCCSLVCLSGAAADHLAKQIGVVNAAVQRMVSAALWLSPLGVGSLVAASILRTCDLLGGFGNGW